MFRQVRGCLFNAEPEMHFARSLYGEIAGDVVGMGFTPPSSAEVESLQPYFADGSPYVVYLGRKETGKNVHVLVDYFCDAKDAGLIPQDLKLVILGGGSFEDLHRPNALLRGDVIDLPHLDERDKRRVLKHALVLCQPSTNESFSIVIMEAWMVGVPVIVHAACPVTRDHVERSRGGLYFSSVEDFAGVVRYLTSHPDIRQILAESGADYVQREYSWSAVVNRFDGALTTIFSGSEQEAKNP
jgi:glycosyltransferase involved in cell wall biosynthesis